MNRNDFKDLIIEALEAQGGSTRIFKVCQYIWDNYHHRISADKKMLYTWQYEIRWAALKLRDEDRVELGKPYRGYWSLTTIK